MFRLPLHSVILPAQVKYEVTTFVVFALHHVTTRYSLVKPIVIVAGKPYPRNFETRLRKKRRLCGMHRLILRALAGWRPPHKSGAALVTSQHPHPATPTARR